jgi:hypothetical protein
MLNGILNYSALSKGLKQNVIRTFGAGFDVNRHVGFNRKLSFRQKKNAAVKEVKAE